MPNNLQAEIDWIRKKAKKDARENKPFVSREERIQAGLKTAFAKCKKRGLWTALPKNQPIPCYDPSPFGLIIVPQKNRDYIL